MALLLKNKHIINSSGEEELLNIYTTMSEAVDTGKPCKVIQVEVDGEMIKGYIGCTDELDTKKASSKRVLVDGVEYAERKYMGVKSMSDYMSKTYPDTYQTMTVIEDEFPDTSDSTSFQRTFYDCKKLENVPEVDTRNGTDFGYMYYGCNSSTEFPQLDTTKGVNFSYMYYYCQSSTSFPQINTSNGTGFSSMYSGCSKATSFPQIDTSNGIYFSGMYIGCTSSIEFPYIDTSNGTNFSNMYYNCNSATSFPQINTSKGTSFNYMYYNCQSATEFPLIDTSNGTGFISMYQYCSKATIVSSIDLSRSTDNQLNGVDVVNMFKGCQSLRSITFNNLPIGTTEETLRSKCSIPSTVTEIIMNYRSE